MKRGLYILESTSIANEKLWRGTHFHIHTNCTFAVGSLKVRYFNGISTLFRHF